MFYPIRAIVVLISIAFMVAAIPAFIFGGVIHVIVGILAGLCCLVIAAIVASYARKINF